MNLKGLITKIGSLGTKKLVVAGLSATLVAVGGTVAYNYIQSNKKPDSVVLSGDGIKLEGLDLEGYTVEVVKYDSESDEYQKVYNGLHSEETPVNGLEVFDIILKDKDGNDSLLQAELEVSVELESETKSAKGEYTLWNGVMTNIPGAEFKSGTVKFKTTELGRFAVSKMEEIELEDEVSDVNDDKDDKDEEKNNNVASNTKDKNKKPSSGSTNNKPSGGNSGSASKPDEKPEENKPAENPNEPDVDEPEDEKPEENKPTEKPEEPEEPEVVEPTYPTVYLNRITTYWGFKGYFTLDTFITPSDLLAMGLGDGSQADSFETEYIDVATGRVILFATAEGPVVDSDLKYAIMGTVKVNAK